LGKEIESELDKLELTNIWQGQPKNDIIKIRRIIKERRNDIERQNLFPNVRESSHRYSIRK
jgi:hypothetical protein